MYISIYTTVVIYTYIYIYIYTRMVAPPPGPEGGMIRLETLIELKSLNSSFSSSNCSIRVVRAYPLVELRQTAPCRAFRGKSSDSRQQHLSQGLPSLPLLDKHPAM